MPQGNNDESLIVAPLSDGGRGLKREIGIVIRMNEDVAPLSDEGRGLNLRACGTLAVRTPSLPLRADSIKLI